ENHVAHDREIRMNQARPLPHPRLHLPIEGGELLLDGRDRGVRRGPCGRRHGFVHTTHYGGGHGSALGSRATASASLASGVLTVGAPTEWAAPVWVASSIDSWATNPSLTSARVSPARAPPA